MGILAVVRLFIGANWKWLVPVLAGILLAGYVSFLKVEVGHYKKQVGELNLTIATMEKEAVRKSEAYSNASDAITAKYADQLDAKQKELDKEKADALLARIKANKELAAVRLSLESIRLFNESKQSPSNQAAPAKPGDVGEASGAATATLQDLFVVSKINDENHLKCVKNLTKWQNFYSDLEQTVKQIEGQ